MRVAVTVWEDTVSTVCDFSDRLLVLEVEGNEVRQSEIVPFDGRTLPERVNRLGTLGIRVLLCGAISVPLERMILASGVKVIPCLRGSIDDVVGAYLKGDLSDARFTLPGFGPGVGRMRRRRGGRRGGFCRLSDGM